MGGRVGLKGTDGVAPEARRRGATPTAPGKAALALGALRDLLGKMRPPLDLIWRTGGGVLGATALSEAGFRIVDIVHEPAGATTATDTKTVARAVLERGVDLILFCGGDGTARDIAATVGERVPILGIPAGVKMYSGVFGVTPARTAEIVVAFARGAITAETVEILDLDEERYRQGVWAVRLYHAARTPIAPAFTQASKALITASSEDDAKADIAKTLIEDFAGASTILILLGPGSTVRAFGDALGIETTLLGVDAIVGGVLVGADLSERGILELLDRYPECKLILSPIGAQGFILGRGNLQLSPKVIRRIGRDNIVVVATPAKLRQTNALRFDMGDRDLDEALAGTGYVSVLVGYRTSQLVKIAT